jgi:GH15 family glucan-1,4-alpha-glucosidase
VKRKDGYAPIEAYAAIGDGTTTALVAADGAIDFLSLPQMHDPTAFAALLDAGRGGSFTLRPTGKFDVERRYVDRSNVLETTFTTGGGVVRITDALNMLGGGQVPWRELARRIEVLSGRVDLEWCVDARPDWGRAEMRVRRVRGVPVVEGGGLEIGVHTWDAGEGEIDGTVVRGELSLSSGDRVMLALVATHEQPIPIPRRDEVEHRLDGTVRVWRDWLENWEYDGPWQEQIARSALALKLMSLEPHGALVAAPTTSLPERIGGDKNYDYRYMWVRDAAFTIDALMRLGLPETVHESFCCLLRAVQTTAPDLRPFYSLEGHEAARHEELPLEGYRNSQPVRYGNAASSQLQLGSWGDLMETAGLYLEQGNGLDDDTCRLLEQCLDRLAVIWRDDDSGIWELDECQSYTASNMASWMALDRGIDLARDGHLPDDHVATWREERDRVRDYVESRCWSEEAGAYVEAAGADTLDAAVLRGSRMGWDHVNAERLARTVDTIRERLDAGGGLLWRRTGNIEQEGAFVACSFWLVEALARRGDVDDAAELFEQLLTYTNDVGLLAEEIDPSSGAHLGNFPQALSHLSLINAGTGIHRARDAGASETEGAAAR